MKSLLVLIFTTTLFAKFIDSDLDGVEDSIDKCPNSKLFDIVNKDGCTTKKLKSSKKESDISYSISLSYLYSKDTTIDRSYSVNISVNYENIYAYIESGSYSVDNNSYTDDITLALFYRYENVLKYTIGAGLYIPQDNNSNNKIDYFIKAKVAYELNSFDTYISYQKTFTKDINRENSSSYSFGIGYNLKSNLYTSLSYTKNNYNADSSHYISLFTNYYITNNIYIAATYTKGLNTNSIDKSYSFTLGYDF